MRERSHLRGDGSRGFSLLEVLIAVGILAIAFLPVMQIFSRSQFGLSKTGEYTTGMFIARYVVEQVLSTAQAGGFASISSETVKPVVDKTNCSVYLRNFENRGEGISVDVDKKLADQLAAYQTEISVRDEEAGTLKRVVVTVRWATRNGTAQATLATLVGRP